MLKKWWNKIDDSTKGQIVYAVFMFVCGLLILGTHILIGISKTWKC